MDVRPEVPPAKMESCGDDDKFVPSHTGARHDESWCEEAINTGKYVLLSDDDTHLHYGKCFYYGRYKAEWDNKGNFCTPDYKRECICGPAALKAKEAAQAGGASRSHRIRSALTPRFNTGKNVLVEIELNSHLADPRVMFVYLL